MLSLQLRQVRIRKSLCSKVCQGDVSRNGYQYETISLAAFEMAVCVGHIRAEHNVVEER